MYIRGMTNRTSTRTSAECLNPRRQHAPLRIPCVPSVPALLAFAFVLAALAPAAVAQTSDSFTGTWEGTVKIQRPDGTEGEPGPIVLNLVQKGQALTGTAGPGDQQASIEEGAVADGKAAFQVQPPDGPLFKFTLTIVNGRLQGEMALEADGVVRGRAKVDAGKADTR
jgi:hypothetical protein